MSVNREEWADWMIVLIVKLIMLMLDDDGGDGGWNGRISEVKVIP